MKSVWTRNAKDGLVPDVESVCTTNTMLAGIKAVNYGSLDRCRCNTGRKLECGNPNVDEGLSTGIGSMVWELIGGVEINELVNLAGLISVGCLGKRVLRKLLV